MGRTEQDSQASFSSIGASHGGEGIVYDGSPAHLSAMPEGYGLAVMPTVAAGACRILDLDLAVSLPGMQLSVPGLPDRA